MSAKPLRRSSRVREERADDTRGPTAYIESSALVAALFERDSIAVRSLEFPRRRVTSALTFAEVTRAVLRGRRAGRLSVEDERAAVAALQLFQQRSTVITISEEVLARAGRPFPAEPVRTLDAIHLASLEQLGGPPQLVTIVTRDARIRKNAIALGYNVE